MKTPDAAQSAYISQILTEYQMRSAYAEARIESARCKAALEDRRFAFAVDADALTGKTAAERDEQRKSLIWQWTQRERAALALAEAEELRAEALHAHHRHLLTAARLEVAIATATTSSLD